MMSNEQFLAMLDKEYPGVDWEHVPDPETAPDVYKVEGTKWQTYPKGNKSQQKFGIHKEYQTREEAERQLEKTLTWPDVIEARIEVEKPDEVVWLWIYAGLRKQILSGETVLPIGLP